MRFVNSYQTKEERKRKYQMLRKAGATSVMAYKCRDWTNGHIERIILPYLKDATGNK